MCILLVLCNLQVTLAIVWAGEIWPSLVCDQ